MNKSLPLLKGFTRSKTYGKLPEEYKEALRGLAKSEGQSMTWVMEQILVDWLYSKVRIAKPRYERKIKLVKKKAS